MVSLTRRTLTVFLLPTLLAGCAVLEDDVDPMEAYRASAAHQDQVTKETERFRAHAPSECADDFRIIRRPVKVEVLQDMEYAPILGGNPADPSVVGYRPVAGEWVETYAVVPCRATRYQALHFRILGNGSVFADVRLPGESLAATRIQQDTRDAVLAAARRRVADEPGLTTDCPAGRITDTAVFDGPRMMQNGWDDIPYWRERWTVDWCDATVPIDVTFIARPEATTYTIGTLSPVKYKNAKDPRASRYFAPYLNTD